MVQYFNLKFSKRVIRIQRFIPKRILCSSVYHRKQQLGLQCLSLWAKHESHNYNIIILKKKLMAAKTGNRLKNTIMKEHSLHFHTVYMWSDSTFAIVKTDHLNTVLKWSEDSFIMESFRQLLLKNVLWTRRTSSRASFIAYNNFYKDDLLVSLQSKPEAAEIEVELSTLLAKVGFELIRWATNCANDKALTIPGLERENKSNTLKACRKKVWAGKLMDRTYSPISCIKCLRSIGILVAFCHSWKSYWKKMGNPKTAVASFHWGQLEWPVF